MTEVWLVQIPWAALVLLLLVVTLQTQRARARELSKIRELLHQDRSGQSLEWQMGYVRAIRDVLEVL